MNQPTLLGKLFSPAGFGLVLLFFLLPFVAVSCGPDASTQITAQFSGLDMVIGGEPDISGPGIGQDEADAINALFADQLDSEPLAILAVLVLLVAMATALIRERLARHAVGLGLAVLTEALVIAAVVRAMWRLEHVDVPDAATEEGGLLQGVAATRSGFWLAVAVLIVLAAGHAVALFRAWKHPTPVEPSDEPDELAHPVELQVETGPLERDGH